MLQFLIVVIDFINDVPRSGFHEGAVARHVEQKYAHCNRLCKISLFLLSYLRILRLWNRMARADSLHMPPVWDIMVRGGAIVRFRTCIAFGAQRST